jgi:surface-anchored protein
MKNQRQVISSAPRYGRALALAGIGALGAFTAPAVQAQLALGAGYHADLGVAFEGGALELHWHVDEDPVLELAPGDAYGALAAGDSLARPPGTVWDFLGTASGQPVWLLPASQDINKLYLGLGAEDIAAGDLDGDTVSLRLVNLSAPSGAHVAVWSESFGNPTALWATSNGLTSADAITLSAGGHNHYNWGFTALGVYTLTIEASALVGGTAVTDTADFIFAVGTPIPEPASAALLSGAAFLGFALMRRRALRR